MAGVRVPTWTLGDRLRKAREEKGLTVQQMADAVGYHRNTITGWESGVRPIKPGMIRAWADICDVSLEWLDADSDQGNLGSPCNHGTFQASLFDYMTEVTFDDQGLDEMLIAA